MRQFTPLFGGTTLAATATLSAFFLGTTIGSLTLGARSRRWPRPLLAFGFLEIGVGLGALLVRPILDQYPTVYAGLNGALSPFPVGFAIVKLLLAMLAVGLPTFFMGGTLPVLGEGIAPSGKRLGGSVGGLYAINVLGAAASALAVPFLLLPRLGIRGATLGAAAGSLTVGAAACVLGARSAPRVVERTPPPERPAGSDPGISPALVLLLAAWSGLGTLGLEVLWTRMFSLVHENSVYSFAVVVVVFLLGLAGGAALARWGLGRPLAPRRLLAWAWSAAGIWIVLSPRVFYSLTGGLEYLPAGGAGSSMGRLLQVAVLALFPACVGLGMALPVLMEMAGTGHESAGPLLGRLLGANTAGAIAGPLLVTFVVAPQLGLWKTVVLLGALTVLAGSLVGTKPFERWGPGIAAVAILVLLAPSGLAPVRVRSAQGERLVSVREGTYGTTAVLEDGRDRWITVNNSYVLGGAAAAGEQRWQGHLPLLLHPSPRRVAFLGMGTGITAGAALLHPVQQVVALEIVPDVVTAARADFGYLNGHLVDDPRVRVVTDDGRNYLASAPGGFDVIVGDLLVPWRPTEATLYTLEHFQGVRRALAPGGVFCQWLPLYQLTERQLTILLRTFLEVFPRTTVWRGNFLPGEPTLALVGHCDPGALDVDGIDRRARELAPSIDARNPFLAHPAGIWLFLVGASSKDAPSLAHRPLNRDDEPWVELLSSRGQQAFVGTALESFLPQVADRPLEGTPLEGLDAVHRAWRNTGMDLARSSLVPGPGGEDHVLALLRTLPAELQRSLGVPPP
jgi:spermidine synthase